MLAGFLFSIIAARNCQGKCNLPVE